MATDPFETLLTFHPRIAGKRSERDPHQVPLLLSAIRSRLGRHAATQRDGTRPRSKGIAGVAEPGPLSRRCLVKAHYVPLRAGGRDASRLHLAYLERDGVERDGSEGVLYGADQDFDRSRFGEELPGEQRQFRFIVSPEDADELDLHDFTRQLMARMEEDLRRPLLWAAVNHHNTEHPHVHIVVRGVDADGRDLRIPRQYIRQDLRWRAQQIATQELGLRSESDLARRRSAEITQERFTSLDRKLGELASGSFEVPADRLAGLGRIERAGLLGRLRTLGQLQLASSMPRGAWRLVEGWEQRLRELGERGDIIKRLHRAAGGDVARYRFEGMQLGAGIEGVVRGKGLHDELTGALFAAVETAGGEIHYLKLDQQAAVLLKIGDVARVIPEAEPWVKATDRVVSQMAQANDGIYDPTRHLAQLERLAARNGVPSPADLVAGNTRRLERLQRYGLVTRLPDGRWKVSADLVQQLESRERTHPRQRLRIEYAGADLRTQARDPGRTWLDDQSQPRADRALWGFGAQLTEALAERNTYLRTRGINPGSDSLVQALETSERGLLARQISRELGLAEVEAVAGFRGTAAVCASLPSGRSYVRVVDERRKTFVLLPARTDANRLAGRLVEVSVDGAGSPNLTPVRRLGRGDAT
jgi:type IV secretory pathway VirD2 relaxase